MKKYIVKHRPDLSGFVVYKRVFIFWSDYVKGFYYPPHFSLENMRNAKKEAENFVQLLKELE